MAKSSNRMFRFGMFVPYTHRKSIDTTCRMTSLFILYFAIRNWDLLIHSRPLWFFRDHWQQNYITPLSSHKWIWHHCRTISVHTGNNVYTHQVANSSDSGSPTARLYATLYTSNEVCTASNAQTTPIKQYEDIFLGFLKANSAQSHLKHVVFVYIWNLTMHISSFLGWMEKHAMKNITKSEFSISFVLLVVLSRTIFIQNSC